MPKLVNIKKIFLFSGIFIVLIGVILTTYLSIQRKGAFEIRKKASESIQTSKLTLVGPNQVKVGEKFSVNLLLDTTADPDYTISGVDALISVGSGGGLAPTGGLTPTCIPRACPAYDLQTNFCQGGQIIYPKPTDPCSCQPPPTCIMPNDDTQLSPTVEPELTYKQSQDNIPQPMPPVYRYDKSQDNIPQPMPPVYRTEPISLLNVSPGKIFDSYPIYPGSPCGGIAGFKCQDGYYCSYGGANRDIKPDEMGTCILNNLLLPQVNGGGSSTSGSSQISDTGTEVNMKLLPTQSSDSAYCPPFPGCLPEGSGMAWNTCWGDAISRCPRITGKPIPPPSVNTNQFTISGIKNYGINENGSFKGYSGQGIFATLNFVANETGKTEIKIVFNGPDATNDTNINGYLAAERVAGQKTLERLLSAPQSLNIEVLPQDQACIPLPSCVSGVKNVKGQIVSCEKPCQSISYRTMDTGIFQDPVCQPPPPDGNLTYCQTSPISPTPITQYISECSQCDNLIYADFREGASQCAPGLICKGNKPTNPLAGRALYICVKPDGTSKCDTSGPTPTPSTCLPKPPCLTANPPTCLKDAPQQGWCPEPTIGILTTTIIPTVTSTPIPTSTPAPTAIPIRLIVLNFHLELEGRTSHNTKVSIFGLPTGDIVNSQSDSKPSLVKLGEATTDEKGYGKLNINLSYLNNSMNFYASTPSHLIQNALSYKPLPLQVGDNPGCPQTDIGKETVCIADMKYVEFGQLIAGDIFVDSQGNKDNVVNNFDLAEMFSVWGGGDDVNDKDRYSAADLNGDEVVNNRDLAILINNYGKKSGI